MVIRLNFHMHILVEKYKNGHMQRTMLESSSPILLRSQVIDTFTALNFSVQDLKTGEHIKDFTARVVVTNGQRLFKFENITVPDGDFSVKYLFPDDGTHQVILRLNLKHSVELASFQVFVPHQSPPGLLNNGGDTINIIVAIGLIVAVGLITIVILKRR